MSGYADLEVESTGDYIRLKAGEVVTFNILSETPTKNTIHWIDRTKKSCPGKACEYCQNGNQAKTRWTCNVWDRKSSSVKKLEFGPSIAVQLKAIAEMLAETQQNIHDVDVRIKTTGSGLETEYSVLNVPRQGNIPKEIYDQFRIPF